MKVFLRVRRARTRGGLPRLVVIEQALLTLDSRHPEDSFIEVEAPIQPTGPLGLDQTAGG